MNYSSLLPAGAALLTAACASTPLVVPDTLRPATSETLATTVGARGVQIYECRARKDGGVEWAFVAPDADLLDAQGTAIGRHGAGPYWQAADGSRVVGTCQGACRCAGAGRDSLAAAQHEVGRPRRRVQQRHQHPAREYGRRRRTRNTLHGAVRRHAGPCSVHGRLPPLHCALAQEISSTTHHTNRNPHVTATSTTSRAAH